MATLCFKNPYVMNIYVSKYSKYLDDNQNYAKHNISMTQIHNYFVFLNESINNHLFLYHRLLDAYPKHKGIIQYG